MEKKAIYNSLRQHYLDDPTMEVEDWQVQDYRALDLDELFESLGKIDLFLDKATFNSLTEVVDSPEDLTDTFVAELNLEEEEADFLFLVIFELWRRLAPQKQTVSLFCDELDHNMFLYDQQKLEHLDTLEDSIANLLSLLNEQVDEGDSPQALFTSITDCLANDLESFLYDYILERIEDGNYDYSQELVDGFDEFVLDPKWFVLLKIRILMASDPEEASHLIAQLLLLTKEDQDLDFQLEFLALLVQEGDEDTFREIVSRSLTLVQTEEELEDLLNLCEEYFHCLDLEDKADKVTSFSNLSLDEARSQLLNLF